jgi:hypothetical protein
MVKKLKYQVKGIQRAYNQSISAVEDKEFLATVIVPWSEENEEIAKAEAYNGEYTIEDDGASGVS